jgi:hypothetical protein
MAADYVLKDAGRSAGAWINSSLVFIDAIHHSSHHIASSDRDNLDIDRARNVRPDATQPNVMDLRRTMTTTRPDCLLITACTSRDPLWCTHSTKSSIGLRDSAIVSINARYNRALSRCALASTRRYSH